MISLVLMEIGFIIRLWLWPGDQGLAETLNLILLMVLGLYRWLWLDVELWLRLGWAPFHYGRWFYDPIMAGALGARLWVVSCMGSLAWWWRFTTVKRCAFGFSISIGFGSYNPVMITGHLLPCRYMTSRYISRYIPLWKQCYIFNKLQL